MEAFSHRLFASSSRSSLAYPRGVVGGNDVDAMVVVVAVDTSFIFHPTTHHLPVPACPRSLYLSSPPTSYGSFTAWRHLGHSHYLLLFVPLSFFPAQAPSSSRSREETGTRFPPYLILRRCFSLFLLFFVSFLSASILLSRSIRPHLSFFLFALYPPPSSITSPPS